MTSKSMIQFDIRKNEEYRLKNQANTNPRYERNFNQLIYLGISENNNYDLYYCSSTDIKITVIAIFDDCIDEDNYKCGIHLVGMDSELTQAYKLAQLRNLV